MAFPFRHEFGGAVQALFGLDHVAGGEAIFAASVLAEFDQIGRIAHRAHDFVELVDAVAVPVRELRYIAPREGRLLLRDRVQPKRRIGDDPRAIAACDLAVHLGAVGLDPFALDAPTSMRWRARRSGFAAPARCPALPGCDGRSARRCRVRPGARWQARPSVRASARTISVRFQSRTFGPKPFSSTARIVSMTWACGLGHSVLGHIPMHIEIGDHAPIHEFGLREVAGQFDALCLRHLARNGEFDLAGKLGILADFERLDIVPEPFAVAPCLRRILRQHHLGMDDAALGGKIVAAIKPLVAQPRARAVGG